MPTLGARARARFDGRIAPGSNGARGLIKSGFNQNTSNADKKLCFCLCPLPFVTRNYNAPVALCISIVILMLSFTFASYTRK